MNASPIGAGEPWYRLPIVWLGATILGASLAGCIAMLVLAARYPDEPVSSGGQQVLKMPLARIPQPGQATERR